MKKLAIVIALGVAACAEPATEEEVVEEEVAVEEPAAEIQLAADGQPAPGIYEVTLENGDVFTETVNPDGTYTWTSTTGESGSGTWRTDGPNVWCTTEEGEEESCNDEIVGDDGVWTSTDRESGEVATIARVDA
ncbi:hypothetical protein [Aurantiacibacter hainanensis]|uniref:hypothetical protein n=1 Tax=Aurantiacibacter hainanensis TaxID=3076114 RepID=UPI0030C6DFCB